LLLPGFFATAGYKLVTADVSLARVRRSLDAGDRGRAMELWPYRANPPLGRRHRGLYFSRRWAAAASAAQDPLEKSAWVRWRSRPPRSATSVPEQRQNAWYNYAILAAALN
jgi:hypothetical protein